MAAYKDKIVPVPHVKGITVNRGDGNRVLFVKEAPYDAKVGYTRPKRITIGYVTAEDTKLMYVTDGFKRVFPDKWEQLFGEKVPAVFKYIGMYAITELTNGLIGIKDIMDKAFTVDHANAMMDFTMYSMLFQTNVAEHFTVRMSDQQLYSGTCRSDSYYSELFSNITYEQILDFKVKWAIQCKEDGVEEVWLCIDGSNDDCESTGVTLAEKGHAKSLRNRNIVSFTYAVTEQGKPVTFDVYRGGLVDAKAMKRIISFLKECGIRVKGVILDRGYCDTTALRYLQEEELAYVIMVKGNPMGYTKIVEDYGNKIKLNVDYLIEETTLFGVQEKVQLFEKYNHEDYLTLFYDFKNGGERIAALLNNLYGEIKRCRNLLKNGVIPVFGPKYKNLLKLSDDKKDVKIVNEKLQESIDEKGLYSIVTSKEMDPKEVHRLYQCRNSSETEYMIVKTQLGYGKVRVRVTKSVHSKFTIGFIAACVRYELQEVAKAVNRTTTEVIFEMSRLYMTKIGESYVAMQGIAGRQLAILKALDSSKSFLKDIAKEENDRVAGRTPTPRHRKPGPNHKKVVNIEEDDKDTTSEKKATKPKKKKKSDVTQKKRGVKPGTKRENTNKDGTPRKKPGVPKGTKRSQLNKDGTPRKKPGPKPKSEQTVS